MKNKFCKCGCGILITSKWQKYHDTNYIKGHGRKNRHNSIEHNQAISEKNKNGYNIECKYCNKLFYAQISQIEKGKKYCSKNCYSLDMIGKPLLREVIEKSRLINLGKHRSIEVKKKISFANSGEKNGQWKDVTILKIKHFIRKRDNFICLLCGLHQEKNKKSLDVHHIDYNDLNHLPQNLISLCHTCHAGTNKSKREFWKQHFQSLLKEKYNYNYDNELIFEIVENKLNKAGL